MPSEANPKCHLCGEEMRRDHAGCYFFCDKHPAPANLPRGMEWAKPVVSDETLSRGWSPE